MSRLRALVTGGAGFIGSHIVDWLMERGYEVIVIDNLSSGRLENIARWLDNPRFRFYQRDLRNYDEIRDLFRDVDVVFHFAADPEVRKGISRPDEIWENNVVATHNVLEAIRRSGVRLLVFASSSTVYGDAKVIPTPEDYGPLEPISVYGASKLACEAMISGYAHTFKIRALVLRYANIIGARSRHGVIWDFIQKLRRNPRVLEILGDGTQRKSYLHISDAVGATMHLFSKMIASSSPLFDVYNVGNHDWITVKEIAEIVSDEMGLSPEFRFNITTEDGRGWVGDVKLMLLDIRKLKRTGWYPSMSSAEAVRRATRELLSEIKVR